MDTALIQDCIDAAIRVNFEGRRQGSKFGLPKGVFQIDAPLRITDVHKLHILGDSTRLVWVGPSDQPLFLMAQSSHCVLEGLELAAVTKCLAGVLLTNLPTPGSWITTACRLVDVHMPHTGSADGFQYGVNIDSFALGAGDTNNEHHLFERLVCNNYSEAGIRINGGQAHQLRFQDCHLFDHGGRGQFGLLGHYGNYWFWNGGSMSGHSVADFYLRDFITRCEIRNFNGEHSRRFVITGGPTGAPIALNIDGFRWDGAPQEGEFVVSYLSPGPLAMANGLLTSIHGVPCRLLHFPPAGMEGGSLSLRNLTLAQIGGETAPLERPVHFSPGTRLDEFGLSYRHIKDDGSDVTVPFYLDRPIDDPFPPMDLPPLPTVFDGSLAEFPFLDLSQQDASLGWSVSCEVSLAANGPGHPHVFAVHGGEGAEHQSVKLWLLSYSEWRLECPGIALITMPYVPADLHKISASYDTEGQLVRLTIDDQELTGRATQPLPTANKFTLGEWPGWPGVHFRGEINSVQLWGRALTAEDQSGETVGEAAEEVALQAARQLQTQLDSIPI